MYVAARIQRTLHRTRHALLAPSRTPRLAVVVGRLLGAAFLVCFATGLFSHFHQNPLPWMVFPTRPVWLYQATQGLHVAAGIACIPLLSAKLYTVFPALFQSPPVRSVAHAVERASIALLVAASLVQLATGMLNTYQWYALFGFSFRLTHYALAWVIIGSLAIHLGVKLPVIVQHWRRESPPPAGVPSEEPADPDLVVVERDELWRLTGREAGAGVTGRIFTWIDRDPAPGESDPAAAQSRRGFLAVAGVAATALVALTAGQSFRVLDPLNAFAPRKQGVGPQGLPVNRTAAAAGVVESASAPDWTLRIVNGDVREVLSLSRLRALPQSDVELPIACVEGWSQDAAWRGPRLRDLLDIVGAPEGATVRITSLQQRGGFAVTTMQPEFARDPLTLVALELNGGVLDIDHGFPARIIAPARPGVLQTKWLSEIEVI